MAEFDGLDGPLRDALGRAATPGDPAGVADAIRARVAAGDRGSPAASAAAPGWGGGVWSWLPWVAVVAVAGLAGGLIGATGALSATGLASAADETSAVEYSGVLGGVADAASCPGGPVVEVLAAGTRVLAIARSEDATHVAVRDPYAPTTHLWLSTGDVIPDAGQGAVGGLPVGAACPEATIVAEQPTEVPVEVPEETSAPGPYPPAPGPNAPAPGDTQAPTVQAWGTPTTINGVADPATIRAVASDNVGVTSVTVSWSGPYTGFAPMSLVGGEWRYVFTPPANQTAQITFTVVALDAAGNASAPQVVVIQQFPFG